MGKGQAEPVLPGLGQDRDEAVGGEVVEFIDDQGEVEAAPLRRVGPGHRRQLELGDEE